MGNFIEIARTTDRNKAAAFLVYVKSRDFVTRRYLFLWDVGGREMFIASNSQYVKHMLEYWEDFSNEYRELVRPRKAVKTKNIRLMKNGLPFRSAVRKRKIRL